MKYIRYVKSQCPGVLGGMYFWMYFLYLMHFLYMVTAMKEFLDIVNEKGEPIGQVLARDTALKMLRQIGNGKSGPGVLRRYEI